jgi:5-methylcytosine-specific restriction endonuclease McrA
MSNTKICPQCNNDLDLGNFYKRPNGSAQSWCKECNKKIRWGRNKDKTRANYKRWCDKNWTHLNEKSKRYRENGHQSEVYQRSLKWLRLHPDRASVYAARRRRGEIFAGPLNAKDWETILDRFNYICLRCGGSSVRLTIDHIIPVSKGGTNDTDNLQPLCKPCNSFKHDRTIDYRGLE